MKKSLEKNTIYNIIKTISTLVVPLIIFPYISRTLQPAGLGEYNFVNSIVSYAGIVASLGVDTYAVRECSKYLDDEHRFSETASEIFSVNALSTVVAYVFLLAVVLSSERLRQEVWLTAVLSSSILFRTLGMDWVNTAKGNLRYVTVRTVGFQVLGLFLTFAVVRSTGDVLRYAAVSAFASCGASVLNYFYTRKYCRVRFIVHRSTLRHLRPIAYLFLLTLSQTLFVNVDTTMIGFFCGNQDVGMYSVSVKVYNLASQMISAISIVVMPQLSFFYSTDDEKEYRKVQTYAFNFIVTVGIPMILGTYVFSSNVIRLLAGSAYVMGQDALRILMIALVFTMFGGAFIGNIVLLPIQQERIFTIVTIIATLLNVILNAVFIPIAGINAAAMTTVASEGLIFFVLLRKGKRYICVGKIWKKILQPVCACIPFFFVKLGLLHFDIESDQASIVAIIICAFMYVALLLLMKNEFFMEFVNLLLRKKEE